MEGKSSPLTAVIPDEKQVVHSKFSDWTASFAAKCISSKIPKRDLFKPWRYPNPTLYPIELVYNEF